MPRRLLGYPREFWLRHPLRALRNAYGNHPSALADRYLRGLRGMEIGGASFNAFFLDTLNVDLAPEPENAWFQKLHAGRVMPVDVVAPADELPFADGEFDFVLASHVIEHMPDPIAALREWVRVACRYVFLVIPEPDNEFNYGRPVTSTAELLERHEQGFRSDEDRHWSVWSSEAFVEFCSAIALPVIAVQDPDDKRGNGFSVVIDSR
jgi:SAM-dependent methyltransferase